MEEETKDTTIQTEQSNEADDTNTETNKPSVEELMAQIAQKDAAYAKLKNASDKQSSDIANLKKQLSAKQTAEEQAEEARLEAEEQRNEYVAGLENFQKRAMAKDRYLAQGMNSDMATKAAEAEVGGDMDMLATIQKQYTDAVVKAKELEWKKSRPDPQAGVGGDALTKEKFDAMTIKEKSDLYKTNRAEYDRLNKL